MLSLNHSALVDVQRSGVIWPVTNMLDGSKKAKVYRQIRVPGSLSSS